MTDSTDKKSKETRDNFEVDLDAMLNEADSSIVSNEFQDDEDAIERLLMNAGFDADDALMPAEENKNANIVKDVSLHDELDDFLSFDDFGKDFNEPENVQPVVVESEQAEGNSTFTQLNETQDYEDDLDRLVMSTALDADYAPEQARSEDIETIEEELGNFSDFNNFDEQEIVSAVKADEPESVLTDDAELPDELDDFLSLVDDFDESDMIQDDEVEASAESVAANEELPLAVDESINDVQDDENSFNSLFADADFSEEDALERAEEKKDEFGDDVALSDEIDDFSGFSDDFSESDLIQDDEVEASAEAVAANEELPLAVDESINDVQDDENSFNSLFADADFGEEDALERAEEKKDEFGDDASLSEIDDFFQLGEDTNDFSVQGEDAHATVTEKSPTQGVQTEDFLLPDFDITADTEISDTGADVGIREDEFSDAFGDTDFLNENEAVQTFDPETLELKSADKEEITESKPNQTVDTSIEDAESARLSPFEFEQEDLKKQLENAENKFKKAKRYGYLAMGFGAVALSAAAGLGVMTYGAKTEVSRLTEAVTTLEANLAKSAANSPSEEVDAMRNSVVLLNKQVDGFITELKGNSQFPADLLNNKVPNIVAKQDMVSKALDMLQVKVGHLEEKVSSAPSVVEPPKVEAAPEPAIAPVKEDNVHEIVPTKTAPEHEQVKNVEKHDPHGLKVVSPHEHAKEVAMHEPASAKKEAVQEQAPVEEKIPHEQAPTKEQSTSETAPVKLKPQPEVVAAKPVVSEKVAVEQKPVKEIKQAVIGKWGVNLVAFKQEWFAKSKAAEFARLGVFAEVIPVHEKNITMYRLRVGGFNTKAEANSNTAKIKQALNLDSVWVSDN